MKVLKIIYFGFYHFSTLYCIDKLHWMIYMCWCEPAFFLILDQDLILQFGGKFVSRLLIEYFEYILQTVLLRKTLFNYMIYNDGRFGQCEYHHSLSQPFDLSSWKRLKYTHDCLFKIVCKDNITLVSVSSTHKSLVGGQRVHRFAVKVAPHCPSGICFKNPPQHLACAISNFETADTRCDVMVSLLS